MVQSEGGGLKKDYRDLPDVSDIACCLLDLELSRLPVADCEPETCRPGALTARLGPLPTLLFLAKPGGRYRADLTPPCCGKKWWTLYALCIGDEVDVAAAADDDDDDDDVVVVRPVGALGAGSRGRELVAALMADCMPRGRVVARDSPPYSNSSSVSSSPADAPAR